MPGSSRVLRRAVAVVGMACAFVPLPPLATAMAQSPPEIGEWGAVLNWGVQAKHMILLPTGDVLVWSTGDDARVWDSTSDASFTQIPFNAFDLHSAGQATMSDGRICVIGGQEAGTHLGVSGTALFDALTRTWTSGSPMTHSRRYVTATLLADGRLLATSGDDDTGNRVLIAEVYDPATDTWDELSDLDRKQPLYPSMFLLPDGRVYEAGPTPKTWFLDLAGEGAWIEGPENAFGSEGHAESAAMYRPGRILRAGGGDPAFADAAVIDFSEPVPAWRAIDSMENARRRHDLTILSDGRVLAVGGTGRSDSESHAVLAAELFDPDTETWTTVAAMDEARMYHSSTVLLPDGRVVVAGGEGEGRLHAQIYSPSYLFGGPRPVIVSAPSSVAYGSSFVVESPAATDIVSVALIRPGGGTHTFDQNQRYVPLAFTESAGDLLVTAPADGLEAPPGDYMLVIQGGNGVPSVASWLRVSSMTGLTPGSIAGVVTDLGTGLVIPGAVVSYPGGQATTNSSGAYVLPLVLPGEHVLKVTAAGYAPRTGSVTVVAAQEATLDLTLVQPGTITGVVRSDETVAPHGRALPTPVAGANVSYPGGSTTTDANGFYVATDVPSGAQTLRVTAVGLQSQSQTVDVPVLDGIQVDWVLHIGTTAIEGEVLDGNTREPIAGADVSYSGGSVVTSATGTYLLDLAPAGTYAVTATAPGYLPVSEPVHVVTGFETTQSFELFPVPPPTRTFEAAADGRVHSLKPDDNYGTSVELKVRASDPTQNSYVRFDLTGITQVVKSAKLRLYSNAASVDGGTLYFVPDAWDEATLTWANAPAIQGTPIGSAGATTAGAWVEFDVTAYVDADGPVSFALASGSNDVAKYSSREGSVPPTLIVDFVSPSAPPVVAFSGKPTVGDEPLTVAFLDESAGDATSWLWTFGDGKTSTDRNPVHTYDVAGLYTVTLTASNGLGTDAMSRADYVEVRKFALSCHVAPVRPAPVGASVQFSATAVLPGSVDDFFRQGTEVLYSWDFGDGSAPTPFSTQPEISYAYDRPGHFTATVTVMANTRTSTCTVPVTIHNPLTALAPTSSGTILRAGTGVTSRSSTSDLLWNVNPDNETVTATRISDLVKEFEVKVGRGPSTLARNPDGSVWVVNQEDATVSVLSGIDGRTMATIDFPYASRPYGIAFAPDGSYAYVTLEATGRLVRIDPSARMITGDVDVGPAPRGLAITADSKRVFVTRFLSPASQGELVEVSTAPWRVVRTIPLALDPGPDTQLTGRGVPNYLVTATISPDGLRLWVPSKKDNTGRGMYRDGSPLTFESTVRAMVAQIDLATSTEDLGARRDLDDRDLPIDVVFTPLGDYAFVLTQGGSKVDVFDVYSGMHVAELSDAGLSPRSLEMSSDGGTLYVHGYLSRSIVVYDVRSIVRSRGSTASRVMEVKTVSNEMVDAQVLAGKRMFHDAGDERMSRDGSLSCASCHLDGGQDARVWDLTDQGEGLRNTIALTGKSGTAQGRMHWTGRFDEVQDFETDIRNHFGGTGFMSDADLATGTRNDPLGDPKVGLSPELDALAAYVGSLDTDSPSPFRRADGSLTADGLAGRALFEQLSCNACHYGEEFTDSRTKALHDVGTIKASSGTRAGEPLTGIDTPTLRGLWQTAPYLHDGSAATLMDVLTTANPTDQHGVTSSLSQTEREQLVAYLRQIDGSEPAPTGPPIIISLDPTYGIPGDVVDIRGKDFQNATAVAFGGVPAASFTVESDTRITAEVPIGVSTGPIAITNDIGTGVSPQNFSAIGFPDITAIVPALAPEGAVVRIDGFGLSSVSLLAFNNTPATEYTVISDNVIYATVPTGATTGKIVLFNGVGIGLSPGDFIVVKQPTVQAFAPGTGAAGVSVAITGTGFIGTTEVAFGSTPADVFQVTSDTSILATVPLGATSGSIRVTNGAGSALSGSVFQVLHAPLLTSFTPPSGVPGTVVQVSGAHFTGVTGVTFAGSSSSFVVVSDSLLTATVPLDALPGVISVTNATGTGASAAAFLVLRAPVITAVTPALGATGTAVQIHGLGFTNTLQISFNGKAAVAFHVESDTLLSTNVPVGATTGRVVVANALGLAVSPQDFVVSRAPVITSIVPALALEGESVQILGTSFLGATEVLFADAMPAVFVVDSDDAITATVPVGAVTGRVRVTTPLGTAQSAADFSVVQAPFVASFAPLTGPVGTAVQIQGTGLTGTTQVDFNGTLATVVTVDSDSSMSAVVPDGARTGPLHVANAAGAFATPTSFLVIDPPRISTLTPASGAEGTAIVIGGTDLATTWEVVFGDSLAAAFTVVADSAVTATVPAGATTGPLRLSTTAGTAVSPTAFWVRQAPVITSFVPAMDAVGGTIQLFGAEFTGATVVTFSGIPAATFSVESDSVMTAQVPAGVTDGPITVINPYGQTASAADFVVVVAPQIAGFSPPSGAYGETVQLTGSGFTGVSEVLFGGSIAAPFTVESDSSLTATVPVGATTGLIVVTNAAASTSAPTNFVVNPPPVISSITPAVAPEGAIVRIEGLHLALVTDVTFNGLASPAVTVVSDTELGVEVPAGATTGPVVATSVGGTGTSPTDFVVAYPPSIAAFTPASGPIGSVVQIDGTGLLTVTGVTIGGVPATTFSVDSDTALRVTVPAGALSGVIEVVNPAGTAQSSASFAVTLEPTIASFTPVFGTVGSSVTILGTNLDEVTSVEFGAVAAAFTVVSDTEIQATVPAGATTARITVTNDAGTAQTVGSFAVTPPPSALTFHPVDDSRIKSTSPDKNYGQEASLRVRGGSPEYRTLLKFRVTGVSGGMQSAHVRLWVDDGSDDGGDIYLVSNEYSGSADPWDEDGVTWNTAPTVSGTPLSSVGNISPGGYVEWDVTAAVGGDGEYSFGVRSSSTNSAYFSSDEGPHRPTLVVDVGDPLPPLITSFSPAVGVEGSLVTLSGHGFWDVTDVSFGGVPASVFTAGNTELTAEVPAGGLTGTITLTNPQGSESTAGDFTVIHLPVLSSIAPSAGPVGTPVHITGTGFTGVTGVTFGGVAAAFAIDSDTSVSTAVPAGSASGKVEMVNMAGTGQSAADFTVILTPVVLSANPPSAPEGASVQILGAGFAGTTEVTFNGMPATSFTVDSDTLITATVPSGSTSGVLGVTNAAGVSTSAFAFVVIHPPFLVDFTPVSGIVGTPVQIRGKGFTGVTDVTFGGVSAAVLTVSSDTTMTAEVPVGAPIGAVVITNAAASVTSTVDFVVLHPPVISSITPDTSPAGGVVALLGTAFSGASSLTFNGVPAPTFSVVSDLSATATVPAGATTGPVVMTGPAGSGTGPADFTVIQPPVVASFSPAAAPTGAPVVLAGSGFTGVTDVGFNGTAAPAFTVDSDGMLTVTVPAGATNGKIAVTNAAATGVSASNFVLIVPPVLAGFAPASGPAGGQVLLTGAGFIGVTQVAFNGTPATTFTVDSDTAITATVPVGATTGTIQVTNVAGASTSAGTFTVFQGPVIVSATPSSGPAGTAVQIAGSGFIGVTDVKIGGVSVASFTIDSDSVVTTAVPAGATTGKIELTNPAGTSQSVFDFTVIQPPVIASFAPAAGAVGAIVQIAGTGLTGVTDVTFGGVSATTFTVDSDTTVTVTVPVGAASGNLTVVNAAGSHSTVVSFTVIVPPVITSVTPADGPVGTIVTLNGAGFTGVSSLEFNGLAAAFTVDADTVITTTVPVGATTGKVRVTNEAAAGETASDFVVYQVPQVAGLTPVDGPAGTSVSITGSGFVGTSAVAFGGTAAASFTVDSDSLVTATVPVGAPTGVVDVTNPAGTGSSASAFTVIVPPAIASFAPATGPAGTVVQLAGTGFTGVTDVTFGGLSAIAFVVESDSAIAVAVPDGAATGAIAVVNAAGTDTAATPFTVIVGPVITSLTPADGPAGTPVIVAGTGFTGASSLEFNGLAATFTVDADTVITTTVPVGATTGKVRVTNAAASGESAADFLVYQVPTVAGFTPADGPAGVPVSITGSDFDGTTAVSFGGVPAISFTVDSATSITATVPSGAATGVLAVTNPAGTGSSAGAFTVIVPPVISAFTPTTAASGVDVQITGTGFTGVIDVTFGGTAAAFSVDSDTQVTATVPVGATTGKIAVTNDAASFSSIESFVVIQVPVLTSVVPNVGPAGTHVLVTGTGFLGVTDVTFGGIAATFTTQTDSTISTTVPVGSATGKIVVANPAGSGQSASDFTVVQAPTIASFTPASGPAGASVQLTGTGFTAASDVTVGGVSASYTVDSDVQITLNVPVGSATGVIEVVNAAGTVQTGSDFVVIQVPVVTSFTPTSGTVGTEIVLTGTGFTGAADVTFHVTAATAFTVDSDTQIRATVPAGSTPGEITVTNAAGTGGTGAAFTTIYAPVVATLSPTIGPAGTPVTITGAGFTGTSSVTFGGTFCTFQVDADTQITATVPSGAPTGVVEVTNLAGVASSAITFIVQPLPEIASFSPVSGPVGSEVVITGQNFLDVVEVAFNDVVSTAYTIDSDTQITATVPANATAGVIRLTTPIGDGLSAADYAVTEVISVVNTWTGGSTGLATVASTPVAAVDGDLYLASVSTKPFRPAAGISGLGLTWSLVESQCSGRGNTGVEIWMGRGTTTSSEPVMAAFFAIPANAVLSVTQYSGASASSPVISSLSGNSNGIDGTCSGGIDESSYYFPLTTTINGVTIHGAAATRHRTHTEGVGYIELSENIQGVGGDRAGLAVQSRLVPQATSLALDGTFNGKTDWAAICVEIQPAIVTGAPSIALSLDSHDYGAVVVSEASGVRESGDASGLDVHGESPAAYGASRTFVVHNEGGVPLRISELTLTGDHASEYRLVTGADPSYVLPGKSRNVVVRFLPTSPGFKSAALRVTSNDPDVGVMEIALTGVALDNTKAVTFEESVRGDSEGQSSVTTEQALVPVAGHLYLASVSTAPARSVEAVSGLGLAWTRVDGLQSEDGDEAIEVWQAMGSPSGTAAVTAHLSDAASSAVLSVARYSGVASVDPIGAVAAGRTRRSASLGDDRATTGNSVSLRTGTPGSVVLAAVSGPERGPASDERAVTRDDIHATRGLASLRVLDLTSSSPESVDLAALAGAGMPVIGIEIRPAVPAAPETRGGGIAPDRIEISRGFPNPFRQRTTFEYTLPAPESVRLVIYDASGRRVRTLVDGSSPAGSRSVSWDGRDAGGRRVASGVYFLRAELGAETITRKMILMK